MVIDPTVLDAYIAKKGLVPRLTDADWQIILDRVAALFGRELWHRCRLVHQAEDGLRRHSTAFPDSVPRPYRYIYHLEFAASASAQLGELQQWLNQRGVLWRECRTTDCDTEREELVGLRIFGYEPEHTA